MSRSPSRHLPLFLVLAAVGGALGLVLGERWFSSGSIAGTGAGAPQLRFAPPELSAQALAYPVPRTLAPFELQRASGGVLRNGDLTGTWTLLFFGFTHCPDVCPTALATFRQIEELNSKLRGGVGKSPLSLNYWFVSVDPERDTPGVLGKYAAYFSPAIVAATATPADVERFARDLGVVFFKVPQDVGDYTIDHSTQLLLIDPEGKLHAMWRPPHQAPVLLEDVRRLSDAASRAAGVRAG